MQATAAAAASNGWAVVLSSRGRWAAAFLLTAAVVALRAYVAFSAAENSDESQHLHVAWAVGHGLVPYRDIFDNHAPLFQLVFSPVMAAIGERADIVPLMRLAMMPLYFIALWLTWYIGRSLWSSRVGTIAAIITAAAPIFFRMSVEFRPDVPWMVSWLGVVAVMVSPLRAGSRAVLAGLLTGVAFSISLKTVLLVASGGVTGLAILHAAHALRGGATAILAGLVAMLLAPALFAAYLWHAGAWDAAVYCLVDHNVVGNLGRWNDASAFRDALLTGCVATVIFVHRLAARKVDRRSLSRVFVISSATLYVLGLYGGWPLVTHQDLLPAVPLLALEVALIISSSQCAVARIVTPLLAAGTAAACIVNVALVLLEGSESLSYAEERRQRTIDLSRPDDPVMDAKGFAIFRNRPVYWVLESVTRKRMRDGSIADTIASRLARTSTPLVLADNLPDADRSFVERNYVCVDHGIFVAGQRIGPAIDGAVRTFNVSVPLRYKIIDAQGPADVIIDSRPVIGSIDLATGKHTLETRRRGPLAIIWSAFQKGNRIPTVLDLRGPHSC